jgi:HEAT repeat protein
MRHHLRTFSLAALAAMTAGATSLSAQALSRRIDNAPEGRVQFTYAARQGVCGNGRSYIQTGPNSYSGSFYGNMNETMRNDPCVAGPVRVVIDRAGRDVISIETFVGPVQRDQGATDLGEVRASDATDYLLGLASKADGAAARQAIMPAMLADVGDVSRELLAIARDQNRPREVRSSAMSWVARSTENESTIPSSVTNALLAIAKDDADNQQVRRSALSVMSRLEHGAGIPPLIDIARGTDNSWLTREAMGVLASSGDPRARDYLRSSIRRSDLPDEVVARAIRGIGGQYATSQDAQMLRDNYNRLNGEKAREATLQSLAEIGGSENSRWLMQLARDEAQSISTRRRALQHATRSGVPITDMVRLYDTTTDPQMKEALINVYVQSGERVAVDKLMAIAKGEENQSLRRRTISSLSRSEDPRVKEFLRDLVER